ncbi:MAG: hypothetical protein ACOYLV_14965, partial [Rubrivivax sp.]
MTVMTGHSACGTWDALRVDASVLGSNPFAELRLERLLACGAAHLVMVGLQGQVGFGREDHGVELSGLFHEHGPALGLRTQAAKSILGFGSGDAHG